ncbi:MAG: NADH-quinone oxidoreductase subunit NuoG [Steroidobacteraceae bacterium]
MAANPQDDMVNIEVDGVAMKAPKGEMIIRVTDAHQCYVPRFCYHDKLSVAANCRMCLVEVEKAPKPLPACATPVAEGMKIFTRSPKAIAAQKATMEFLLINHPLDCPICDQGGECELQDLAMGFGRDISRFHERKRIVRDKNLGPLISTDMTRCIHCTRCVRFGQEIAGFPELGTTGRGEDMQIGTYIERAVNHELSGNIIDLCPVGALNSKPFRFSARAWEMTQHELISPHDGVGSNMFGHVLRGRLMRVVPRSNDAINETWLADRDRFSYEALHSPDRLVEPALRNEDGSWRTVPWREALERAAEAISEAAESFGILAADNATVEELYLLATISRARGPGNIDHRLRQLDFRADDFGCGMPDLGHAIADTESQRAVLVLGSNLRSELPLLAHRLRRAALRGAQVSFINPARYEYFFPVANYVESAANTLAADLAAVLHAACAASGRSPPALLRDSGFDANAVQTVHREIAATLVGEGPRAIWLGALAQRHPAYAELQALAGALCDVTGASLGILAEGGNARGAWLAGAVPRQSGLNARQMLQRSLRCYLLFGGVEPWCETGSFDSHAALRGAQTVIAATPFANDALRAVAHVLLPITGFAESAGTYVNLEGLWQSQQGIATAPGQARPGWKVARVLGNLLQVPDFEFDSADQVRDRARENIAPGAAAARMPGMPKGPAVSGTLRDIPMYQLDAMLRRAPALAATLAGRAAVREYPS